MDIIIKVEIKKQKLSLISHRRNNVTGHATMIICIEDEDFIQTCY